MWCINYYFCLVTIQLLRQRGILLKLRNFQLLMWCLIDFAWNTTMSFEWNVRRRCMHTTSRIMLYCPPRTGCTCMYICIPVVRNSTYTLHCMQLCNPLCIVQVGGEGCHGFLFLTFSVNKWWGFWDWIWTFVTSCLCHACVLYVYSITGIYIRCVVGVYP